MERILLVDDEPLVRRILKDMISSLGYEVLTAEDGKEALEVLEKENPSIILMDVEMPIMDGITAVKNIREKGYKDTVIIMLTIHSDPEIIKECAIAGADDFLTKSIDKSSLSARLELAKKASIFYSFQKEFISNLKAKEKLSKDTIDNLLKENASLSMELLDRLFILLEYREDETYEHTKRVGEISCAIAGALGKPDDYCYYLKLSAPLHDIGKVSISDRILLKPGPLTPEEFAEVKRHTIIGKNILSNSKSPILRLGEIIAISHHERWDGKGYPYGLREENIPLEGRVVCIADAIDCMFSKRPYKDPIPEDKVRAELLRCKGTQFDPQLVDTALKIWETILDIEKRPLIR